MTTISRSQIHRGRFARPAARTLLAVLTLSLGVALGSAEPVFSQAPQPTLRVTTTGSISITDTPRQYDLMHVLLDFAPGAATSSHRVNGRGLITVVSGEITRVEEGKETVFKTGQTFPENLEDHFDVDVNKGSGPARLLATFLLQPGAEPLIIDTSAPPPKIEPKFVAVARTTVGTIPAEFTLSHTIAEALPGFAIGLHTHDGWHLITTLSGNATNRVNGVVQGATFAHGPRDVHEAANTSNSTMTYMSASINPRGGTVLRLIASGTAPQPSSSATQAAPTVRPPSTGDAGLSDMSD